MNTDENKVKAIALRALKEMLEMHYDPHIDEAGICLNSRILIDEFIEEEGLEGITSEAELLRTVDAAEKLIEDAIQKYAIENGRDLKCPVENGKEAYEKVAFKWAGKHGSARRSLMKKLVLFIETGDEQQLKGKL